MQNLELSARSSFEVELFISEPQTVTLTDDDMERIKVCTLDIQTYLCILIFVFFFKLGFPSKPIFLFGTQPEKSPRTTH